MAPVTIFPVSDTEGADHRKPARRRRWIWIALAPVMIFAGIYFAEHGMGPISDDEKLRDLLNGMNSRMAEADRVSAARIEAQQRNSPLGDFGPEQALDAKWRSTTRAWAGAGIAIIDESLARRELILGETIARMEASGAGDKTKSRYLQAIRNAAPNEASLSVRIMKAMRAYLAKVGEMVAWLDLNAQAVRLREGEPRFDDKAAGARYDKIERELAALQQELEALLQRQKQARK